MRVFLRHSVAQISGKYFMACPLGRQGSGFEQRALVHVQLAAGEFRRLGVVGDHDDGLAVLAVQHLQQVQHLVGGLAVEVAGRLVADQQGRIGDQRAGDGDALRLAAGQFAGLVLGAVGEADQGQRRLALALRCAPDRWVSSSGSSTLRCALSIGIRL